LSKLKIKTMKKLLLTLVTAFTILFAQAQIQCQADFSHIQNGPTTVFTDLSTIAPVGPNYYVAWDWDFGDGSSSNQQNPVHTYSNGIYFPCLTVTFFDTIMGNSCTSVYCDSLLIGNGQSTSWDCDPINGCYDPLTGNGQYTSFAVCDTMCGNSVIASWDCALNTMLGCSDPGTGLGQYNSLSACQIACSVPCSGSAIISQNGNNFTVNMTGGVSPFLYSWSTGESTQSITALVSISGYCVVTDADSCVYMVSYSYIANPSQINWCDSTWFEPVFTEPVVGGMVGPFDLTLTGYISDSLNDVADTVIHTFTTLQTSMSITNYANIGSFPYSYTVNQILVTDTVTICWASELYLNGLNTFPDTCGFFCEDWIFDLNTGFWAKMGSVTSLGEIISDNKKLIKIVDILGRETFPKNNEILFYIYEDGTIDKRYIKE
jgi:hypothetical protein